MTSQTAIRRMLVSGVGGIAAAALAVGAVTASAGQEPPDPCRAACLGDGTVHRQGVWYGLSSEVVEHRSGGDPSTSIKSPGRNEDA